MHVCLALAAAGGGRVERPAGPQAARLPRQGGPDPRQPEQRRRRPSLWPGPKGAQERFRRKAARKERREVPEETDKAVGAPG